MVATTSTVHGHHFPAAELPDLAIGATALRTQVGTTSRGSIADPGGPPPPPVTFIRNRGRGLDDQS